VLAAESSQARGGSSRQRPGLRRSRSSSLSRSYSRMSFRAPKHNHTRRGSIGDGRQKSSSSPYLRGELSTLEIH
jgi:hypothetical protein